MAAVAYSARALADLERIAAFLREAAPAEAQAAVAAIVDAVEVLERHPFIGRVVRGELRELVISRGRTGHVALYRVSRRDDRVEVHAVRHQRDAGYA